MTTFEVVAEGLGKRYGPTRALDTFDLTVPAGTVHGLLGPNGAGKTTAVRILTTLLRFDTGRASVAGYDVLRRPDEVRARIALTGQYAAVDEILSGRQNLELFGRLFRLGRREARRRAGELLERFGLDDAASRSAGEYSGGMRRRLDLAASLIRTPRVLFLDEPTTGLDPRSRNQVWDLVRGLVADGTTVLLTTQYLEEADQLADRISVIDAGRVVAEGSPDQLKAMTGGDRIEVVVRDAAELAHAARHRRGDLRRASPNSTGESDGSARRWSIASPAWSTWYAALDDAGIAVEDIGLRRATLDEAFLHLTGHRPDDTREPVGAGRKAELA